MSNLLSNGTLALSSFETSVFIFGALIALLICLYYVFFFGRKAALWPYIRGDVVKVEADKIYSLALNELYMEAEEGPLDPNDPPPDSFGPVAQLWVPDWTGYSYKIVLSTPPPILNERDFASKEEFKQMQKSQEADYEKRREALEQCMEWEKRERRRFDVRRRKLKSDAWREAEFTLPRSIDTGVFGGGYVFLLEFSTVIVIIFALIILGVTGTMGGEQISTILAAIAGYVLGKTAAEAMKSKEKPEAPKPIQTPEGMKTTKTKAKQPDARAI